MIKTGIVSVTFRKLSNDEIINISKQANIDAIEWGGDIHVPLDNIENAKLTGENTRKAGLSVASYGSYYRVGCYENYITEFSKVLLTAINLGAPNIRVWAGNKGSSNADYEYRKKIADESYEIAKTASLHGITVSYECHGGTLTDSLDSYISLLNDVKQIADKDGNSSICTYAYFQPYADMPLTQVYEYIDKLAPFLTNVHVFNWRVINGSIQRFCLSDGGQYWRDIFNRVKTIHDNKTRYMLIEFVKNDSCNQFLEDVIFLKDFLN